MEIILDHFYQHLPGDVGFTVSLPPVLIEIPQSGTLQLTDLTVPGLDLVMDVAHVVPQCRRVVELEFTLIAWLSFLPLVVISPNMTQEVFVGGEVPSALETRILLIIMIALDVIHQISKSLQNFSTVYAQAFPRRILVDIPLVLA